MKKQSIILICIMIFQIQAFSQDCLPNGIQFQSQEEIDNFKTNYSGCTEIGGNVIIQLYPYLDITNLDSLNGITSIGGDFQYV